MWYVLMTIGGQEERAKRHLEHYNQTVFCPMIYPDPKSKLKKKAMPLFKNYIFIRMKQDAIWTDPINTRGVLKWVTGTDRYPSRIPDKIIDSLMFQEMKSLNNPIPKEYKAGEKVKILTGVFAGFEGIYQKPAGQREAILLQAVGRVVEFPKECVEPIILV